MRTHISFLAILGMCVSCSLAEPLNKTSQNNLTIISAQSKSDGTDENFVTESDILAFKNFLSVCRDKICSGSVRTVTPVVHNDQIVFYILDFENGWQVISADKRGPVILAQSAEGTYSETAKMGVDFWLDMLAEEIQFRRNESEKYYISATQEDIDKEKLCKEFWLAINADTDFILSNLETHSSKLQEPAGHYQLIDTYVTQETYVTIDHLLTTEWHQHSPFNSFCPYTDFSYTSNCPAGCVTVAGAQTLYYLHSKIGVPVSSPTTGFCTGTYANYSMGFSEYSTSTWGVMGTPYDYDNYAGLFMANVAQSAQVTFGPTETSGLIQDLGLGPFASYGIAYSIYSGYSSSTVTQNLMNELPVIFGGNRYENLFSWPGHAFVIDGYHSYRNVTHFIYEWVYDEPGIQFGFHPPYETISYSSPIVDWYKINWGYGNYYGENDIECSTNGIWTNPLISGATPYEYSRIMMYGFSTL